MGEFGEKPQDWKIRQYYEQKELIEIFVETAKYREVAPTYPNGYGKRPDAINFPGDFQQFVENGAVAFHSSVEKWRNPLLIDNVSNLDDLRESWDLVIDIDCDESFKLAKDTAELVIEELRQHGIDNISVKFSGNRGFHIGVRSEAFPEEVGGESFKTLYPNLGRGIVDYIRNNVKDELIQKIENLGHGEKIQTDNGVDPFQVTDIENDWGQRHLFRMPYSLHDGSWLVSKPISPDNIQSFEKEQAEMENIEFKHRFLKDYEANEAANLAIQAMDFLESRRKEKKEQRINKDRDFERPESAVPEKYFPPTINNILQGLDDGRKRGLFILINFLRCVGYSWNEIESKIWEWNDRNKEALSEAYVKGQLNWHRNRNEEVPPPNYNSNGYYKDMQVYEGTRKEEDVPNPVSYAFREARKSNKNKFSGSGDKETDEEDFECPYCGKEYELESYYKKHVQKCDGDGDVKKIS